MSFIDGGIRGHEREIASFSASGRPQAGSLGGDADGRIGSASRGR